MKKEKNIYEDIEPDEGRDPAARQFRWSESVKDTGHAPHGVRWIEDLGQDVRYGVRMLCKKPSITAVAALTFALGIGVNAVMFSLLSPFLFQQLPYPDSERLVRVYRASVRSQTGSHSLADFLDQREQNHVIDPLAAYMWEGFNFGADGQTAERLTAIRVTSGYFKVLGIQPVIGRAFTAEETQPGQNQVAVLSDGFWTSHFASDTNVIGRTLRFDGEPIIVIGVMPAVFEYPELWGRFEVWRPFVISPAERGDRDNRYLNIIGRLKPGVSPQRAQAEMSAIAARLEQDHPEYEAGSVLRLVTLADSLRPGSTRRSIWFLLGLTGCVLLIACVNLANLQLARLTGRSREFAVRAALGARSDRLMRLLLTESLLISLLGGVLGLLFASSCDGILGDNLGTGFKAALDFHVIAFALVCCLVTTVVFGTVPAWFAARTDPNEKLKESVRSATDSRSQHRFQHLLIIGEVALALMLLTGAGSTIRLLQRFSTLDPGWHVDGLLTAQVSLPRAKYSSPERRNDFCGRLEERLASLPGVQSAAFTDDLPIAAFWNTRPLRIEDRAAPRTSERPLVSCPTVSPAYFQTLGISLRQGRGFTSGDKLNRPAVAIINDAMARQFWPDRSPVGKRISIGDPANPQWMEIVGVVGDVGFPADPGNPETRFQVYRPKAQDEVGSGGMVVLRTTAAPESTTTGLRQAVSEMDPDLPVYSVSTVRQSIDGRMRSNYLITDLLGAFGILGLLLAAVGVYGVASYSTAQRIREIGIRLAFGAQKWAILWLFVGQGLRTGLFGAVLGLGGAFAIMRMLDSLIPAGSPMRDPVTLAGLPISGWMVALNATVVLSGVTLLACYLPAHRAAKVDPMVALRCE